MLDVKLILGRLCFDLYYIVFVSFESKINVCFVYFFLFIPSIFFVRVREIRID